MKANELMIGDWVNFYSKHIGYGVGVIAGIEPREGSFEPSTFSVFQYVSADADIKTNAFYGIRRDAIEPIPLTETILKENGWTDWHDNSTIARSCSFSIDEHTSICFQQIIGSQEIYTQISHCGAGSFELRKFLKYVHELQHALRFCGIEKEISIPKEIEL